MKLILSIVGGLVVGFFALVPTGRYLVRGAWAEGGILAHRKSIVAMVADSTTPAPVRSKLKLVLDARSFATDSVHLKAGSSFTTYSQLKHDTLVLVLSAAYRDRLEQYTWWFPIVGRVPYKGFFNFELAKANEQQMATQGYDVYLRPSSAFSTLGWFNDPLLSTTLGDDSLDLANTVIHELTHNTFYAAGQAVFNESFANFTGARGSAWFFRTRGDSAAAREIDARWSDEKLMATFWQTLYTTMDSAFSAHPDDRDARLAARDVVYGAARTQLVFTLAPKLQTIPAAALERMRLDNAALMARRIYLTDLDLFDAVWAREGHDLPKTITQIVELAKSNPKDPYAALRTWLGTS